MRKALKTKASKVNLTDEQHKQLTLQASKKGLSVSEYIKQFIPLDK
jgi:hypothetical protein